MRFRGRVDANQKAIVEALRAAGASVEILSNVGKGCPDLLVGFGGVTYLLEAKNPSRSKPRGRVEGETKDRQESWHQAWRGTPPVRVFTAEEALQAVGAK